MPTINKTLYCKLVKIGDNDQFRKVMKLMGWETVEDQNEVIDELRDEDAYITYDEATRKGVPKGAEFVDDIEILFTIGGEEGNRWFPTSLTGFRDKDGQLWVNVIDAMNACS